MPPQRPPCHTCAQQHGTPRCVISLCCMIRPVPAVCVPSVEGLPVYQRMTRGSAGNRPTMYCRPGHTWAVCSALSALRASRHRTQAMTAIWLPPERDHGMSPTRSGRRPPTLPDRLRHRPGQTADRFYVNNGSAMPTKKGTRRSPHAIVTTQAFPPCGGYLP